MLGSDQTAQLLDRYPVRTGHQITLDSNRFLPQVAQTLAVGNEEGVLYVVFP